MLDDQMSKSNEQTRAIPEHAEQTVAFSSHTIPVDPHPEQTNTTATRSEKRTRSGGGLMAGLAIGALVGAIAGGATGALVSANQNSLVPTQYISESGQTVIETTGQMSAVSAIAQAATQSVVTIEVVSSDGFGTGSGIIYTADGYIITNRHVITDASPGETQVRVFLSDGTILPAEIVGSDPYADIAVIKVDAQNLPAIKFSEAGSLKVGDLAVAIGAPFNLSNTVTSGVISTLYRGISVGSIDSPDQTPENKNGPTPWNFDFEMPGRQTASAGGQVTLPVIQTDADINPGNSGGALLNERGELIGVNVAIASTGAEIDAAGSVGLGFAIPGDLAERIAKSLISGEVPSHGLLGATVEDSRGNELSTVRGGLVREVTPGGAAEKSGIKPGDIIVSVGGVPTIDGTSVSAMVRYHEGGAEVEIGIQREGSNFTEKVTLGELT